MRYDALRAARPPQPLSPHPPAPGLLALSAQGPAAPARRRASSAAPCPGRGVPAARCRPALGGAARELPVSARSRRPGAAPLGGLGRGSPGRESCGGSSDSGRDPRPGRVLCCGGGRARDAGLGQGQSSRCALRARKFCVFQNNGLAAGKLVFLLFVPRISVSPITALVRWLVLFFQHLWKRGYEMTSTGSARRSVAGFVPGFSLLSSGR